jgi:hypothetical protein
MLHWIPHESVLWSEFGSEGMGPGHEMMAVSHHGSVEDQLCILRSSWDMPIKTCTVKWFACMLFHDHTQRDGLLWLGLAVHTCRAYGNRQNQPNKTLCSSKVQDMSINQTPELALRASLIHRILKHRNRKIIGLQYAQKFVCFHQKKTKDSYNKIWLNVRFPMKCTTPSVPRKMSKVYHTSKFW